LKQGKEGKKEGEEEEKGKKREEGEESAKPACEAKPPLASTSAKLNRGRVLAL
jgi:hypothetical protein